MTACIRRPHSVWTNCKCDSCLRENARMAKRVRAGMYRRVSSEDAWAVVDSLFARDWTDMAIASATGLPVTSIHSAVVKDRQGRRPRFSAHHAAAIVNHGVPTAGLVGATGACRRLRGLTRQGWGLGTLTKRTGIPFTTLSKIRSGTTRRVYADVDTIIRETADAIGLGIGDAPQAVRYAAKQGWQGLLAWEDIDDPAAEQADHYRPIGAIYDPVSRTFGYPDEPADEAAVQRILNGDWRLSCSKADKFAVVARWTGELNDLERLTGWKVERYIVRDPEAAA